MSTSQNMAATAGGPPEWRNRGEFPGGPGAVPTAVASPQGSYFYGGDMADNTASAVYKDLEIYAAINPPGTNTPDTVYAETNRVFIARTPELFTYDADGNMTSDGRFHYVWNGENRLVCASNAEVVVTYAYDHRGRMVRKEISHGDVEPQRIEYLWDDWNIIRETTHNLSTFQPFNFSTDYVWGLDLDGTLQGAGGVGGLLAVLRSDCVVTNSSLVTRHSSLYLPTYDANGNISEYVSTNGEIVAHYDYSPFGEPLVASGPLASTFTHQFSTKPYCAATGLSEYQMRKYRPDIGRWMSRDRCDDLISIEHIDSEASFFLIYNFVGNSPLFKLDYLGLHTRADCDFDKEICDRGCRRIPPDQKLSRKLCWIRCYNQYAACIASSEEALIAIGCATGAVSIIIIAPQVGLILIPAL